MHAKTHIRAPIVHVHVTYGLISLRSSSEWIAGSTCPLLRQISSCRELSDTSLRYLKRTCMSSSCVYVAAVRATIIFTVQLEREACAKELEAFLYRLHEWQDTVINTLHMPSSSFLINTFHKHLFWALCWSECSGAISLRFDNKDCDKPYLSSCGTPWYTLVIHKSLSVQCSHCVRFWLTTVL